ncbi:hypothetical protein [Paraburkholderia sp. SIMBA_030]
MNIAYWLRLVSLALYMTDPGRVAFDPALVGEYAAAEPAARCSGR